LNIHKRHSNVLLLILICIFSFTNIAHSQSLAASEIIEKAWPCVVKISVLNEDDSCFTGFTAPISSGNSGSPVLSHEGSVVGVTSSSDDEGQNLNFSVSIQAIQEFLAQPDSPHKLGSENDDKSEDSASLIGSTLNKLKKAGLDVVNFIVFTGRGIQWSAAFWKNSGFSLLNLSGGIVKKFFKRFVA